MTTSSQQAIAHDFHYWNNNPFMWSDLFRMVCGEKLGAGGYRAVYDFPLMKRVVVKVAGQAEHNVQEMMVWRSVSGTPHEKHFAPCIAISPCGHFLLQKKVRPINRHNSAELKRLPKYLPDFFTDIKYENWGFIGTRLVCSDYQFIIRAVDCSIITKRKVKWE